MIYKDGHIEEMLISEVPEPEDVSVAFEEVERGKTIRRVDPDTKAFMDNAAAAYDEIMDQKVGELAFDMLVRDESGEPLDLQAEYTVTTSAFIQGGADGYGMFKEADVLRNRATPDNEVVMQYIRENLGGVIPDEYRESQGRIVIKE